MVSRLRWSLLVAALFTTGYLTGAVWQPAVVTPANAQEQRVSPAAPATAEKPSTPAVATPPEVHKPIFRESGPPSPWTVPPERQFSIVAINGWTTPREREDALATAQIATVFDRVFDVHCHKLPLLEFARLLKEKVGVNVWVDTDRIKDEGVSPDAPISCDLDATRLEEILEVALRPLQLTAMPYRSVIYITTHYVSAELQTRRIYNIRFLLDVLHTDMWDDRMIELIKNQVAPHSWDDVGGPGSIDVLGDSLFIAQTYPVHREIEHFLDALEKMATRTHPDRIHPRSFSVRSYPVTFNTIEQLSRSIQETIDPASWQQSAGLGLIRTVAPLPDRHHGAEQRQQGYLIIRQTNHNHSLIRSLLADVNDAPRQLSSPPPAQPRPVNQF